MNNIVSWFKQMAKIFFLLLMLSVTFGIRKQFESGWGYFYGSFNEYAEFFVYLSDIFLLCVLVFWIVALLVEFWKTNDLKDDWTISIWSAGIICCMFCLVLWSWYSGLWAGVGVIAMYKALRLTSVIGLLVYILMEVKNDKSLIRNAIYFLLIGLFVQAVWGIGQYIWQSDFGLQKWGETKLAVDALGVAKVDVGNVKIIRPYGGLPHANIYGMMMWIGFVISSWLIGENIFRKNNSSLFYILSVCLFVFIIGVVLSFSRVAWLASVLVGIGIISVLIINKWWKNRNVVFLIAGVIIFKIFLLLQLWPVIGARLGTDLSSDVSWQTRDVYDAVANGMIADRYYSGVGMGNFVMLMPKYVSTSMQWWMYQPVHNLFKLVWSELGVFGFIAILLSSLFFMFNIWFATKSPDKKIFALSVGAGLLVFMLCDHMFWDVWQAQIVFVCLIGFVIFLIDQKQSSQIERK